MNKKGISAIVATVLMILVTVAGIAIVWTVILPMFADVNDFKYSDIQLGIVLEGYTVCDAKTNFAFVQVKRGSDELTLAGMEIIFDFGGNSVVYEINSSDVPMQNQRKTYAFNLSIAGQTKCPERVKVAPIILEEGRRIIGRTVSEANMPKNNVQGDFVERRINEGNSRVPRGPCSEGIKAYCTPTNPDPCRIYQMTCGVDKAWGKCVNVSNKPGGETCDGGNVCYDGECVSTDCPEGEIFHEGVCAIKVDSCSELNKEGGVYVLTNNVSSTGHCLLILSENVTLDGNGFEVVYGDSSEEYFFYGVLSFQNGTTIRNLRVRAGSAAQLSEDNRYGIYFIEVDGGLIENVIAHSNSFGLVLDESSNNTLRNLNATSNYRDGIYLVGSSNNTLRDLTANSNSRDGVNLINSSNNTLRNLIANLNGRHGIYLVESSNNTLRDLTANSNSRDGVNLINSSNNILRDLSVISNGVIEGPIIFGSGIQTYNSHNNFFLNIIANSNFVSGIILYYSSNNTLAEVTATSNNETGLYLYASSNNTLNEVTTISNKVGIELISSSNNNISNSNACSNNNLDFYCFHNVAGHGIENNHGSGNKFTKVHFCNVNSWPTENTHYTLCP